MVALPKEISTSLGLDKLAVEVDRVLDRLVLDRQDLDTLNDLIEVELGEDVIRWATHALLTREAEVYTIFHHEEALLSLGSLQSLKQSAIDLAHCPRLELSGSALLVNKRVAELCADRDICISKLLQADSMDFTMVLD